MTPIASFYRPHLKLLCIADSYPVLTVDMKTMWSPEAASKAYIQTLHALNPFALLHSPDVAEFVSALAAGSNAYLIVEAWTPGAGVATSVGLAVASRHTGGRHVCVVSDERSRLEYLDAISAAGFSAEVVVGAAEVALEAFAGVDFLVLDGRRRDLERLLSCVKMSSGGTVLVCTDASGRSWLDDFGNGRRILRSSFLPVGKGLEIVQLARSGSVRVRSRWINLVDRTTGEEYFIRR